LVDVYSKKPSPEEPGDIKELRTMSSIAQFRKDMKRAMTRRRLYARISALPPSTVREELVAIAQRYEAELG
jgi:hypothetical protein